MAGMKAVKMDNWPTTAIILLAAAVVVELKVPLQGRQCLRAYRVGRIICGVRQCFANEKRPSRLVSS